MNKRYIWAGRGAAVSCCAVVLLVFGICIVCSAPKAHALDYPESVGTDYLYKTSRVVEPPKAKSFWDYLSFFAWKSKDKKIEPPAAKSRALRARVKQLSKQLMANSQESIADEYVLTVDSFVNLNNLYKTSSLGRYISEELLGNLQSAGVEVIDVRKTAGIMIHQKRGEYGLSRDMQELSYIHRAQAMVVGTYTYADGQIFINARILRNDDGMVLSNASLAFDLDSVTRQMLSDDAAPPRKAAIVRVQKFSAREDTK